LPEEPKVIPPVEPLKEIIKIQEKIVEVPVEVIKYIEKEPKPAIQLKAKPPVLKPL
jgi:hypothetical protein